MKEGGLVRRVTERTASRSLLFRTSVVVLSLAMLLGATLTTAVNSGHHDQWRSTQRLVAPDVDNDPDKLVFAHYFPPYPISIDNRDPASDYYTKDYLSPGGENGIHADYGGFLRDRPLPRAPRAGNDWRERDLATEIGQAMSAGIDGFSVDILAAHDDSAWIAPIPAMLLRVAERTNPSFKIMLMPDMNGELGEMTPNRLADEMALLAASPAAFRLGDGRLVIAPYLAEKHSVRWWQDFLLAMKAKHDIDVAFVPVFLDPTDENIDSFASISYGMSSWGSRSPANNPVDGFVHDMIARVHGRSKIWMAPVAMQDYRPRDQIFDEAENTTNLRNMWQIAVDSGAEWVQIVTWNDYSENTVVAPSARNGDTLLNLVSYYIAYFKAGVEPPIVADKVFVTHRTQLLDAKSDRQPELATLRRGGSPGRNAVEALSFMTAPPM